jgi:glucose-1-phosphate cytidylyltransferase
MDRWPMLAPLLQRAGERAGEKVKVVLFCGGQGLRIRDHDGAVPKPMVQIGNRPILWHVMKYYATFGHTDFILCLGYKSEVIKDYFLNYKEWASNDFVMSGGGREIRLLNSDIDEWNITFADTGIQSNIAERLKAVEPHLAGEELFLANYADGLTDLWLPDYLDAFRRRSQLASFVAVRSPESFHVARIDDDDFCTAIEPIADADIWFNAGYFIFRPEIFGYINEGEELVEEPFARLVAERQLTAYRYEGFWQAMDTFKDKQALERRYSTGDAPWQVWRQRPRTPSATG